MTLDAMQQRAPARWRDVLAEKSGWRQISGPLFRKYVALFLAVVCVALLSNGLFEIWFSYREHKTSLIRIQREQAEAAAAKIGQFIREIESQVGWTTQLPWSAGTIDQRRFDGLRLLRQVPAITELAQLDSTGREQLKVSRLATDVRGREVLTAYASVAPLGWIIFVELPSEEAYAPLYDAIKRSGALLFAGLMLAFLSGVFLARRMVVPIKMLRTGAARIGAGDLTQRISIKTGDELEGLDDQFNDMEGKLQESYSGLEHKVEQRTEELAQSVGELRALGEVSQAVNSTLDLETVLNTIVTKAVQLSGTEAGAIYVYDEAKQEFELRSTYGMSEALITAIKAHHVGTGVAAADPVGKAYATRAMVQIPDLGNEAATPVLELVLRAGYRALLVVPLVGAG